MRGSAVDGGGFRYKRHDGWPVRSRPSQRQYTERRLSWDMLAWGCQKARLSFRKVNKLKCVKSLRGSVCICSVNTCVFPRLRPNDCAQECDWRSMLNAAMLIHIDPYADVCGKSMDLRFRLGTPLGSVSNSTHPCHQFGVLVRLAVFNLVASFDVQGSRTRHERQ